MASSAKDIQLRELKDTVSQLKTMISEQTELIQSLRLIIDEKSRHEKALQEQVDYLTKKLFGSSSERRSDNIPGQQNLFDEAEMEQDPSQLEEETVIREHTRKKKATHEDLFKGLKVEKVVIPLPEEEQICPVCGTQMVLIGEEYVRRELEFIPATCKVIEYYSQPAVQGVQYCNRLFAIEDSINKKYPGENSCVSRRKNLFWRPFGRGSSSRSLSGTLAWIKR